MIRWHNVVRGHFCIKWAGTKPALALQLKLSPSLFFRKAFKIKFFRFRMNIYTNKKG